LTALFRLILAIPLMIWLYVYAIVAYCAVAIAWFAIVITGKLPCGLFDLSCSRTPTPRGRTPICSC
jgi:Domain of unknown function (DUF4389)